MDDYLAHILYPRDTCFPSPKTYIPKEHSKNRLYLLLGLLPHLFVTGSAVRALIPLIRTLATTGRNLLLAKVDFPSLIWNKTPTQKRHVIFSVFLTRFSLLPLTPFLFGVSLQRKPKPHRLHCWEIDAFQLGLQVANLPG